MQFWIATAFCGTDQLLEIARAAQRFGYDGIAVADHLMHPAEITSEYPYSPDGGRGWSADTNWPDPWVAIAAMAAVAPDVRFTTNVYVAPARDPFSVAKSVATAAVISQNGGGAHRVAMGVGPGWCAEEFAMVGQDFHTRGRRLDEMLPLVRALWTGGPVEHHGAFYDVPKCSIAPVPGGEIPIWIGGDSAPALRRAARFGDGWIGVAYLPEQADAVLARLDDALEEHGRAAEPFTRILSLYSRLSPDVLERYEERGVTGLIVAPWLRSLPGSEPDQPVDVKVAALERFAEKVIRRSSAAPA